LLHRVGQTQRRPSMLPVQANLMTSTTADLHCTCLRESSPSRPVCAGKNMCMCVPALTHRKHLRLCLSSCTHWLSRGICYARSSVSACDS
jgi:hypothetical protein